MKVYPVVMAGGAGTRFWPLSRRDRPKQLLALAGDRPLLQATLDRLPPLARLDRTFVVCGPGHAAAVRRMVPRLPRANEPSRMDVSDGLLIDALRLADALRRFWNMRGYIADHEYDYNYFTSRNQASLLFSDLFLPDSRLAPYTVGSEARR